MEVFKLHSRYYYIGLPEKNRRSYKSIYYPWSQGASEVTITLPGTRFEAYDNRSLHDIVQFVIEDNPQLFHLETSQIFYSRTGTKVVIHADPVYSPQEYRDIYEKLNKTVRRILKAPELSGDFLQRVLYLHDYLAGEITYFRGNSDTRSQREIHTIVGALLNRACVCDGYSRAFRLLCDMSRISCIVVSGTAVSDGKRENHAWNVVKNQGKKYHIDVTWDSNISSKDPITHIYCLRSDQFFQRDHFWDQNKIPRCNEEIDFPSEIRLQHLNDLEMRLDNVVKMKRTDVTIHLPSASTLSSNQKTVSDALQAVADRNPCVLNWRIYTYDTQPCILLQIHYI